MKDQKKAEEIASHRVQLMLPLLADGLDAAKVRELKKHICKSYGISERTLRRYLAKYRNHGFTGLKPKGKGNHGSKAIAPELLEQAILLRREVPSRSVAQIIQILEWEGRAKPGEIKRATLQEKLSERGYSSRQMRMYTDNGVAARRFQHRYRNQLIHSDNRVGGRRLFHLPTSQSSSKEEFLLNALTEPYVNLSVHTALIIHSY